MESTVTDISLLRNKVRRGVISCIREHKNKLNITEIYKHICDKGTITSYKNCVAHVHKLEKADLVEIKTHTQGQKKIVSPTDKLKKNDEDAE